VPKDNEAWAFSDEVLGRLEPVKCYVPDQNGIFTSRTVLISRDATLANLLDSLGGFREGLEPLNAPLTTRIRDIHGNDPGWRPNLSVLFVGPADVFRRALPEDTRRTTEVFVKDYPSTALSNSLVLRVDVSEHGDFVIELKRMVQERLGIPPSFQRIVYAGKQLEEHNRLRDYGVRSLSTLHVMLRMSAFRSH
jgi:ubiquitin-large subunit ribosomal protein L40e